MTDNIMPPTLRKTFWLYGIGYLSILYSCAMVLVFAPIEILLGIQKQLAFAFAKFLIITGLCGYGSFKIVRLVLLVARYAEPEPNDKLTVEMAVGIILTTAIMLFGATTGIALYSLLSPWFVEI